MKRDDARTLHPAAQEEKRKQAVRLFQRQPQMTYKAIADQVGVHPLTVGRWIAKYREGGMKALLAQTRGRREGAGRQLTPAEEDRLQTLLVDKTPDQLELSYALWTRQAVQQLIQQETGKTVPIRTVGEYLRRWGFTVQKPRKQAYEQRPAEVKRWLDETYPAIQARAKAEHAEIHWGTRLAFAAIASTSEAMRHPASRLFSGSTPSAPRSISFPPLPTKEKSGSGFSMAP